MKHSLFFCLLLIPLLAHAGHKEGQELCDSLLHELPHMQDDTNKVTLLCRLSNVYCYIDQQKGITYGNQGLQLAKQLDYQSGIAKSSTSIGNNYFTKYDNARALKYFLTALSINESQNNKVGIAGALGNIANTYTNQSNYPAALEYNFKALKIFEELGDNNGLAINLSNIGSIYRNQSNYPKALEYNFKALKISEHIGLKTSIATVLSNIGNIYMDRNIFDTALVYDLQAMKITEELGDKVRLQSRLITAGVVYLHLGKFDSALDYHSRGLHLSEELGDQMNIACALGSTGDCYLYFAKDTLSPGNKRNKTDNLHKAISYLERALAIDKEINDLDEIQIVSQSLSETYFLLGDYKAALEHYKTYITAKDSMFSAENNLKIADLETTRNLDLKEKDIQIEQLKAKNKRNERFIYIGGIIFLLIIIAVVVRKFLVQVDSNRQLSHEKQKNLKHIQKQGNVLKDIAHIQAHDVRGSVATLLGLAKLFNRHNPADPHNAELMGDVIEVTERLDKIIKDVVSKENNIDTDTHID